MRRYLLPHVVTCAAVCGGFPGIEQTRSGQGSAIVCAAKDESWGWD
jgi:hypothetical protein